MKETVNGFEGAFDFLSNFYECNLMGVNCSKYIPEAVHENFKTTEHMFQALKSKSYDDFKYVNSSLTPGQSKRRGREVTLREDWDKIKLEVMEFCLRQKFLNKHLRDKLVDTYPYVLIEYNGWQDTYWGVDSKTLEGKNHLGNILMNLRSEYMEKK